MSHIPQAQQDEYAFVQAQISKLASVPVQYGDDFVTPEEGKPKKAQLVDIAVTPLPEVKKIDEGSAGPSSDTVSLLIKSLKPPLTFSLPAASLSDPVSSLKEMLLASYPHTAPPPSHQRLLLKGKALSDGKLLREYIQGNKETGEVTINLMIKAGWPGTSGEAPPVLEPLDTSTKVTHETPPTMASGSASGSERPVTPIPTLTLTPSPDVQMSSERTSTSPSHSPHQTLSNPTFWVELLAFFRGQYAKEDEADAAWETFLRSQKGGMSPSEVAMARDESGVHGMGGM